jgi:hypothetical protein
LEGALCWPFVSVGTFVGAFVCVLVGDLVGPSVGAFDGALAGQKNSFCLPGVPLSPVEQSMSDVAVFQFVASLPVARVSILDTDAREYKLI